MRRAGNTYAQVTGSLALNICGQTGDRASWWVLCAVQESVVVGVRLFRPCTLLDREIENMSLDASEEEEESQSLWSSSLLAKDGRPCVHMMCTRYVISAVAPIVCRLEGVVYTLMTSVKTLSMSL